MECVHDSAGRSSQVQGDAETRLTFGFLGWASVLSPEPAGRAVALEAAAAVSGSPR